MNTYSNLIFPPVRNSLSNSQRKNTARLKTEEWMAITKVSVQRHANLMFVSTSGHQFTWWVPVKEGEAPWRAERSRVSASCSTAHWTWDADVNGSNKFPPPKESLRFSVCRHVPAPMGLSYSGIVNNGGQQSGEAPQQEGGEELADDWALQDKSETSVGTRLCAQLKAQKPVRLTLR